MTNDITLAELDADLLPERQTMFSIGSATTLFGGFGNSALALGVNSASVQQLGLVNVGAAIANQSVSASS